jgi:heme/copper-type cytochrome/quinol oxidase subunit 3
MTLGWVLLRIVCFFQTAIAAFVVLSSIFGFVRYPSFTEVARALLYLLVLMLSIFTINVLNNNYPDKPIEGPQKSAFNRLFLLNFVFLAFQFGFVFAEYRSANRYAQLLDTAIYNIPFYLLISLITYSVTLIFQLIIFYGLYTLRRLLYENFRKKKFDFEK